MMTKRGTISYASILAHYEAHKNELQQLGLKVEALIVEGRNHRGVPAYVTKMRVKDLESLYLKTKRKAYDKVEDITDIIGLRVLCLFEQDIAPTFEYLFEIFSGLWVQNGMKKGEYQLAEVTLFNWGNEEFENSDFMMRIGRVFASNKVDYEMGKREEKRGDRKIDIYYPIRHDGAKSEHRTVRYRSLIKGSGYKSVHLIVKHQNFSFEVQLRTLLQDVWGELEHSLAYKHGSINPFISRNFELFARELQVKDNLMSELMDVRDRDQAFEQIDRKATPSHWLGFNEAILKRVFDTPEIEEKYKEYEAIGRHYSKACLSPDFIDKLQTGLGLIKAALGEKAKSPAAMHWVAMEEAFLAYCEGDYSKARQMYEQQLGKSSEIDNSMWAVHYRLGELHVHEGNVAKALISFDAGEAALNDSSTDISDRERYFVNTKLAYVYWELGFEYIDIAIEKIVVAERFFEKFCQTHSEDSLIPVHRASLLNNRCYYYLEGWLIYKDGDDGEKTFKLKDQIQQSCKQLEDYLEAHKEVAGSNMYDTLAWFYFNRHLEGRGARQLPKVGTVQSYDDIKKAKGYLQQSQSALSFAISPIKSAALRGRHAEAILVEYNRLRDARLIDGKQ